MFFDFFNPLNTIQPLLLGEKLKSDAGEHSSCVLDYRYLDWQATGMTVKLKSEVFRVNRKWKRTVTSTESILMLCHLQTCGCSLMTLPLSDLQVDNRRRNTGLLDISKTNEFHLDFCRTRRIISKS